MLSGVIMEKTGKRKILVVDDEKDGLLVLERTLAAERYSVITAENGRDAIIAAASEHPDLVILDVALPDMLGGEVAAKLKESIENKNIPIIFLSAMFSKTEESRKGHVVGSSMMFAKPYDRQELLTAIKKILGGKTEYQLKQQGLSGERKKILIVDTEQDLLRSMCFRLKKSGYDVVIATDGVFAISTVKSEQPDLILLDINLPAGDGFAVMRNISLIPQVAFTPIIVITARDPVETRTLAIEAGAQAFFQKPVDIDELLDAIRNILEETVVSSGGADKGLKDG
jgi:DNA-binding response OmpR family regulator